VRLKSSVLATDLLPVAEVEVVEEAEVVLGVAEVEVVEEVEGFQSLGRLR
jgi:hypothetical protein